MTHRLTTLELLAELVARGYPMQREIDAAYKRTRQMILDSPTTVKPRNKTWKRGPAMHPAWREVTR